MFDDMFFVRNTSMFLQGDTVWFQYYRVLLGTSDLIRAYEQNTCTASPLWILWSDKALHTQKY